MPCAVPACSLLAPRPVAGGMEVVRRGRSPTADVCGCMPQRVAPFDPLADAVSSPNWAGLGGGRHGDSRGFGLSDRDRNREPRPNMHARSSETQVPVASAAARQAEVVDSRFR